MRDAGARWQRHIVPAMDEVIEDVSVFNVSDVDGEVAVAAAIAKLSAPLLDVFRTPKAEAVSGHGLAKPCVDAIVGEPDAYSVVEQVVPGEETALHVHAADRCEGPEVQVSATSLLKTSASKDRRVC